MSHYVIIGILYNCKELENSCSSCLGLNIENGFTCGWCSDEQCTVTEECSVGFSTTTDLCPKPTINSIHPRRGPREGGTHVTITGTNLGADYSDILDVTLRPESGDGTDCRLVEALYVAGRQIVCVTENVSEHGKYTLEVRIQRESEVTVVSDSYFVEEPVLTGVEPSVGPKSGGIEVVVSGENLAIGNTENTTVQLNGVDCIIAE